MGSSTRNEATLAALDDAMAKHFPDVAQELRARNDREFY